MDRDIYKANMQQQLLESEFADRNNKDTFELYEGNVHDLIIDSGGQCRGISMEDGTELRAKSVVLTTGTFLGA